MVTKTRPRLADELTQVLTQEQTEALPMPSVREVGERIGIPVVIRPWWGSRRQLYIRRHKKCGHDGGLLDRFWCSQCQCFVEPKDINMIKLEPGRWVCPAGYQQQLKWPTVEGDKVVMWEGRCGARYFAAQRKRYGSEIHIHRQALEVLDFSAVAMLVRVSVGSRRLNFLIGRDDGHPFVQVVTKNQVTVDNAYDYLVPVPVFNAQMHGVDVKRQGDFFFVPREFFRGRPVRDEKSRVRPWPGRLDSRVANAEYGTIYSHAPIHGTRHIAERLIWACPHDLVRGVVTAPDHPAVKLETWHVAIRNRRSPAFNPDSRGDDD